MATPAWRRALQRGVALGLTLAVHLGLMAIVTLPPAAIRAWRTRAAPRDGALQIRLIAADPVPDAPVPNQPPPALRVMPQHQVTSNPLSSKTPTASARASPLSATPPPASSQQTHGQDAGAFTGDGGFAARLHRAQEPPKPSALPGSSRPIVAGLHMVDPRHQGLAGAIRIVGGIFGAEDPHCVDVDAWRGMTRRELADHGLVVSDVEQTAKTYHCAPSTLPMAERY